jgi:hypothetical protein
MKEAAVLGQLSPGIRIHAIDIFQPPGIVIAPIADIDPDQAAVSVALAAKSSAEVPKNACCDARSEIMFVPSCPTVATATSSLIA